MKILLTGAGGAAAISVWKSLNTIHTLYMADIDPCAAGLYLVPALQRIILPKGDAKDYVENVLHVCEKFKINLIIPTVDIELIPLSIAYEKFEKLKIFLPLSPVSVLKCCYDKYALLNQCKNKIPIPESLLLTDENKKLINTFPKFAKPRVGAGSAGIYLIKNFKDLENLPMDGSYLIQEWLPGDEFSVDVYINSQGKALVSVPRIRMKIDSGVAVAARTQHNTALSLLAIEVAKVVGILYVANIQFKRAVDGTLKLLEINPRFPGTLPLTAAAGIDIPQLLIKDLKNETLPNDLLPFNEIMVVRYWTEHFCSIAEWEALCLK